LTQIWESAFRFYLLYLKDYIKIKISGFLILLVFSFSFSFTVAQTKTNLEIFYGLVDSSVAKIDQNINSKDLKVTFSTGDYYRLFQNQVIADFVKLGRNILSDSIKTSPGFETINYSIDNANVKYGDMERNGLLGDFVMQRKIDLSGSYSISKETVISERFDYVYIDTVSVDDAKAIENPSFPFTQAEIPSEPFFSSLLEPAIAIGSAALAVILFFTIRSK
jgi:hypothetical protein